MDLPDDSAAMAACRVTTASGKSQVAISRGLHHTLPEPTSTPRPCYTTHFRIKLPQCTQTAQRTAVTGGSADLKGVTLDMLELASETDKLHLEIFLFADAGQN